MDDLRQRFARADEIDAPDVWPEVLNRPVRRRSAASRPAVIVVAFAAFAAASLLAWRAFAPAHRTQPAGNSGAPEITLSHGDTTGEASAVFTFGDQIQQGRFIEVDAGERLGFETKNLLAEEGLPGYIEIERGAMIDVTGPQELKVLWITDGVFHGETGDREYLLDRDAEPLGGTSQVRRLQVEAQPSSTADLPPLMPGKVGLLLLGRWPGGEPFGVLFGLDVTDAQASP